MDELEAREPHSVSNVEVVGLMVAKQSNTSSCHILDGPNGSNGGRI